MTLRTLTLSDGEQYTVDDRGVMQYVEPEGLNGARMRYAIQDEAEDVSDDIFSPEEVREISQNIFVGDTTFSNTNNVVATATNEYMMSEIISGLVQEYRTNRTSTAEADTFTSDPIENFNWSLFIDLWSEFITNRPVNGTSEQMFNLNMREYRRHVHDVSHLRNMGNTQRVVVTGYTVALRESNRVVRRRERHPIRHSEFYSSFAEQYGDAIRAGDVITLSPDGDISSTWHPHTDGLRGTPDDRPRQLRPKVCKHKSCIRCKGTCVYGKDDTPCLHHFECHCIFCKP